MASMAAKIAALMYQPSRSGFARVGFLYFVLPSLRREDGTADEVAFAQVGERGIRLIESSGGDRDARDRARPYELHQLAQLLKIADVAALDGRGLDRDQRQRPGRAAAEQADDDELAAPRQDVEAERRALGAADEVDDPAHRSLGSARDLGKRVGIAAVDCGERPAFERRAALARVDVDHDRALAAKRLQDRQGHQAEPAGADH